ncbi:fumarylacetoacetate hydrolase family protein [Streptomyces sp. NPDC058232]|uniref:fumarylacetoacetate hydrolase family protein n=1 Tax=Streptomyces sp. NPDC058232 TaxID=3346393 RepID=UPI0036E24135
MRIMNVEGRLALLTKNGLEDVATLSGGRFGPDVQAVYESWDDFRDWAESHAGGDPDAHMPSPATIGSPTPQPRQVFAIGLNYRDHAREANLAIPEEPPVFTKFLSSLTGPFEDLVLPTENVDWEIELVAVIGRRAEQVRVEDGWSYIAGLSIGQDYSERVVQRVGPVPQFSLGKSFPGFGPIGPWLVTPDEFADPDDLGLECTIDGDSVQQGRTSSMIFSVPELVARLSAVTPLLPGDVLFTGTPAGVGAARRPRRFLKPGETVRSAIDGLGFMSQTCVASR